ncbi:MAG: hypothetical protein GY703_19400 [Gammaproteobacteria bacterium]|nr:hypothetical protein [Gammaproteobacteria bacterium]
MKRPILLLTISLVGAGLASLWLFGGSIGLTPDRQTPTARAPLNPDLPALHQTDALLVGFDWSDTMQKMLVDDLIQAAIIQNPEHIGRMGLEVMVILLSGGETPRVIDVPRRIHAETPFPIKT